MINVLGYFVHKDDTELNPLTVMVIIESEGGDLMCYCPAEQHCKIDRGYFNECVPISKADYLKASAGFYTPKEYL